MCFNLCEVEFKASYLLLVLARQDKYVSILALLDKYVSIVARLDK